MNVTIFDWGTRSDFLLKRLYPSARIVTANPLVDADTIVRAARENFRNPSLWLFHLNISFSEQWLPHREAVIENLRNFGYHIVNGRIVDIRKSTLQKLNLDLGLPDVRVTRDDDPFMRVMVKTDYNYGGVCESKLSSVETKNSGLLDASGCSISSFDEYYVCEIGQVSEETWQDKRLVVEKYIDNDCDRFCRYYRCGGRAVLSEVINRDVIKKMVPGLPRENWYLNFGEECPVTHARVVRNAIKMCRNLALEFGALDIVIDQDGCPYIIDVNPTPGWGLEEQSDMLSFLRGGF